MIDFTRWKLKRYIKRFNKHFGHKIINTNIRSEDLFRMIRDELKKETNTQVKRENQIIKLKQLIYEEEQKLNVDMSGILSIIASVFISALTIFSSVLLKFSDFLENQAKHQQENSKDIQNLQLDTIKMPIDLITIGVVTVIAIIIIYISYKAYSSKKATYNIQFFKICLELIETEDKIDKLDNDGGSDTGGSTYVVTVKEK